MKDFYSNEQLVELTKNLADMLRRNRTIGWNRRESERANMRRLVKRLLKKYKYPPEEAEGAMNIVLKQCEQWAENGEYYTPKKLMNVEDDTEVRNLIYNRLQMHAETSDMDLQREVIELYGERYPDMTLNDWRHIIEAYTPMVREASHSNAKEISMQPEQIDMAAEEMGAVRR